MLNNGLSITADLQDPNLDGDLTDAFYGSITSDEAVHAHVNAQGGAANGFYTRTLGDRTYELSNHLGNVLSTVSDRKVATLGPGNQGSSGTIAVYQTEVLSTSDYYPFGMAMAGRNTQVEKYRFGFNGMEQDGEWSSEGTSYTTEFRQYDSRLGRWRSIDPVTHHQFSPYSAYDNNPIFYRDPSGADGDPPTSINGFNYFESKDGSHYYYKLISSEFEGSQSYENHSKRKIDTYEIKKLSYYGDLLDYAELKITYDAVYPGRWFSNDPNYKPASKHYVSQEYVDKRPIPKEFGSPAFRDPSEILKIGYYQDSYPSPFPLITPAYTPISLGLGYVGIGAKSLQRRLISNGWVYSPSIGNFKFNSLGFGYSPNLTYTYPKFGLQSIGKWSGRLSNTLTLLSYSSDVFDYSQGNMSGGLFAYRTTGFLTSLGTMAATGYFYGGPVGGVAGLLVGTLFAAGEYIYNAEGTQEIIQKSKQGFYEMNHNPWKLWGPR